MPDEPSSSERASRSPGGNRTSQQSILTEAEMQTLGCVIVAVWMFIFFGGMAEWRANVPGRCVAHAMTVVCDSVNAF
eukprot:SAG31_NODE_2702_length_5221_cov_1.495705_5_plen_77_part_00